MVWSIQSMGVVALLVTLCGCERAPERTWDADTQGGGVPVSPAVVERLRRHDRERGRIDELDPAFRRKLRALLDELRERGWAARVAIGPRTVKEQMRLFGARKTRVLRGAHLCGLAADLSLYPVGMPSPADPFWDAKDQIARGLGLDVVDYAPESQKFVDRPHVELRRCDDADWDRLELSPVGHFSGAGYELRLERRAGGLWGTLVGAGPTPSIGEVTVTGRHIAFDGVAGDFSLLTNGHGLERPDYRTIELTWSSQKASLTRD